MVDIPIPGNDDSMRSIEVIVRELVEAVRTGKSIREVAEEQTELSAAELDAALDPFKMTRPE